MGSKLKVTGWIALGAMAGALTTMQFNATARSTLADLPLEEVQQLAAVFDIVKNNYVLPVDEKKLINSAIVGMVSGLDPHSQYFEKREVKPLVESLTGKFVGVGIEIGMEDGVVKVVSPIEGSPAFRAGIKTGDLIIRIDNTEVRGLAMDEAVKRMRGEPNTKVVLTIYRKSESRSFPVTIVREEIKTQSVRARNIEPGYAWIRVSQFQERTVSDFGRKVNEVFNSDPNLKGLVLDLRNDPGGELGGAIALSAAFLPRDVTVVSTRGRQPDANSVLTTSPVFFGRQSARDVLQSLPPAIKSIPLVVLVNEGSASASEIVAGALQDHKRATVMGAQTFGKGSVQSVICLNPGFKLEQCPTTAIKLTTARYYTPSGKSIQATGIVPDIWLDETAEGNLYAALRMREADLEKHLQSGQGAEQKDAAREKAREEARKKLEEETKRNKGADIKPPPEFGSADDFQLIQALNQLKGKPVQASKTLVERKAEADTNK